MENAKIIRTRIPQHPNSIIDIAAYPIITGRIHDLYSLGNSLTLIPSKPSTVEMSYRPNLEILPNPHWYQMGQGSFTCPTLHRQDTDASAETLSLTVCSPELKQLCIMSTRGLAVDMASKTAASKTVTLVKDCVDIFEQPGAAKDNCYPVKTVGKFPCFITRKSEADHICPKMQGRYTKSIENYSLTVPHRLSPEGQFLSFSIPQHFTHNPAKKRRKRSLEDSDLVHYGVSVNGQDYHIELWPNHDFVAPNMVFENRDPNEKIRNRKIRSLGEKKLCHYTGRIRGYPNSRAAVSTCDGLAGYLTLNNVRYFIEPVEEHEPNEQGHHLHLVYKADQDLEKHHPPIRCGTSENWEEAWKDAFREKLLKGEREERGTTSEHRYLETLIVADKKFLDHHKGRDVDLYIMTIMNMVSDFYHDASSGNLMDVVVVRMMYLYKEEEEVDLEINQDSDKTLASFCNWQIKINPPVDNPIHHDIAVLLTRYDLCAMDNTEEGCGLMGLAYVAAACLEGKPCAINEDSGITLGIVVAHEMGHVMGCSHDKEGESSCAAQDEADQSFFVMAPYVHLFTTKWSTCSRGFMTALFENGLGDCLNDEPQTNTYQYKNVLPGVVYDADAQCQFNYPKSTVCIMDQNDFCSMLLCKTSEESCSGNGEPPVDGTKCGENKWCFHSKCVEIGQRPEAMHGGWGEWGSFSSCSRSCGGGVSSSTRDCTNPVPEHGGRYCLGERKKVKICNTNPCPADTPSYRQIQCTEQNSVPFNDHLHTWKVFDMKDEPCALYCVNEARSYAKLKEKVEDGTPCKAGTKNMCIDGVCKKVGCDYQVNSEAVEDICGICNGDGTQCKIIEEVYRDTGNHGYKKVVTIPAGSRRIRINELGPSVNTLAISDKTEKKFWLNPDKREEQDGEKHFGNVDAIYSHPEPGKESLVIEGPLPEDLNLFVVFYNPSENVGYSYSYAEPSSELGYTPHYQWELLEWSDCSMKCGGGVQTAKFDCVEDKAGKVSNNFCMGVDKPDASTKPCNEDPCKTKWKVGKWSKCHACKNRSGVRMREVECVQESPKPGTDDMLVDDDKCTEPKPGSRELCDAHAKCKGRSVEEDEEIPSDMMEDVWYQINKMRGTRDDESDLDNLVDQINTNGKISTGNCTEKPKSNASEHLQNIGLIVKDKVPPEEIKVIQVPLRKSHTSFNLTDEAFESMGDTVEDSLDTSHSKIITGAKAANVLKKLQHRYDNETGKTEVEPHSKLKAVSILTTRVSKKTTENLNVEETTMATELHKMNKTGKVDTEVSKEEGAVTKGHREDKEVLNVEETEATKDHKRDQEREMTTSDVIAEKGEAGPKGHTREFGQQHHKRNHKH
ncbi:hypothetical protein NQ315_002961 [Exocentrus adspersus]|uniref:Peptidase M12B domain-containing protein n=1 Tax=Exocentrus adspersus TaxID=1586481 RepID=A0AAV8W3W1_9CUCU|nr:hypothetical protein NQ315_002961 [Exocentrus adspersus]